MWNAQFGIGYDEAGQPYLSFYDKWDFARKDESLAGRALFGAPIEIYDRLPLTEALIQKLSKIKHNKDKANASDKFGSMTAEEAEKAVLKKLEEGDVEFKTILKKLEDEISNRYK